MAVVNPPAYIQASSHPSDVFRRAIKALAEATTGVVGATDLAVSQNGTPNMSVNVAAGLASILGTENTTSQGAYVDLNDAVVNLAIAAADPTNPRNDLIVFKVQDAQYSGAVNAGSLVVVQGTPAGSPVDPATPSNAIVLARVRVDAAVASIVNAKITDLRPFLYNSANPVGTLGITGAVAASRYAGATAGGAPASGTFLKGDFVVDQLGSMWVCNGAGSPGTWAAIPMGRIGSASVTANQTPITAQVDLAGLTATVTVGTGRRIKILLYLGSLSSSVVDDTASAFIMEGATQLDSGAVICRPAGVGNSLHVIALLTPTGGSHTYKAQAARAAGTGNVTLTASATQPSHLIIEDIGT